jgi:hypothetical protein
MNQSLGPLVPHHIGSGVWTHRMGIDYEHLRGAQ